MTGTTHKATLLDGFKRLAARDAGGGSTQHGLESERERILEASDGTGATERMRFDRLYRSRDLAGGYRVRGLTVLAVLTGVGGGLILLAWWLGGLGL